MTIILRLQGLDVKAGPEDIRKFFECLHIPDGGVYIVGGSLREAFIAFSSERDGQLAMHRNGNLLKGSRVTLHVSSMAELEHKLMRRLKKRPPTVEKTQPPPDAEPPPPSTETLDANAAFLLGVCTVLQTFQARKENENNEASANIGFATVDRTVVLSDEISTHEQADELMPGYVRLFGLPASVTKDDICHFFNGLEVQEAIVNINLGLSRGCLVKFANTQDANDALSFNLQHMGSICVQVRGATEKMWCSALQECESPSKETAKDNQKSISTVQAKRQAGDCLSSKSQKKHKSFSTSTTAMPEYIVMVSNLPRPITKTEIKELFGCPNIARSKVLHLLDEESKRTDTAFLIFDKVEDYDYAMNLTGCHVGSNTIKVLSVSKELMNAMLTKTHPRLKKKKQRKKSNAMKTQRGTPRVDPASSAQTCLFVRNLRADVQQSQIQQVFSKYVVKEDDIFLLHDRDGNGTGEALVKFKSQKLAALAYRHHGQTYLGTKLLLTPISPKQMVDILKSLRKAE